MLDVVQSLSQISIFTAIICLCRNCRHPEMGTMIGCWKACKSEIIDITFITTTPFPLGSTGQSKTRYISVFFLWSIRAAVKRLPMLHVNTLQCLDYVNADEKLTDDIQIWLLWPIFFLTDYWKILEIKLSVFNETWNVMYVSISEREQMAGQIEKRSRAKICITVTVLIRNTWSPLIHIQSLLYPSRIMCLLFK